MLVRILKGAKEKYSDIQVGDIGEVYFIAKTDKNKNIFLYRVNSYCYILEEGKDFEWVCDFNNHNKF